VATHDPELAQLFDDQLSLVDGSIHRTVGSL
jgi:hypothetical protein